MANHTGVVIESQPDWLTCSAHGQASARNLLDLALGLAEEEKALGNRERRWRLMGYEGSHVGRIEYGQRDKESTILRLIGEAASTYLTVALASADEVTRLDLAATWRAEPADPMIAANAYTLAHQWWTADQRRAKPTRILDPAGGGTTYLGSRQSENFLRIYDKHAECIATNDDEGAKRYQDCWRFELEVKGGNAKHLAERVDGEGDRATYVRTYLHNYLTAHGIEPPWPTGGAWHLMPGFRRRSDEDTKLRHLAKNVAPTVRFLASRGRLTEVKQALGLESSNQTLTESDPFGYGEPIYNGDVAPDEGPKEGEPDE